MAWKFGICKHWWQCRLQFSLSNVTSGYSECFFVFLGGFFYQWKLVMDLWRLFSKRVICWIYIHFVSASVFFFLIYKYRSSETHKLIIKVASSALWTLLLPAALSPAADPSGGLSLWLMPLCSHSIVLPAPGMLTSTGLENTQIHVQTHIYVCVYLWALVLGN